MFRLNAGLMVTISPTWNLWKGIRFSSPAVHGTRGQRSSTADQFVLLPRTLEKHLPYTIGNLEGPFELILDESPRDGLPPYCGSESAVFPNSPVDVWCIGCKLGLASHGPAIDRQR